MTNLKTLKSIKSIESLDTAFIEREVIKHPIHICFTYLELQRWLLVKKKLKEVDSRLKIQDFARIALRELMDSLDDLIAKHNNKPE